MGPQYNVGVLSAHTRGPGPSLRAPARTPLSLFKILKGQTVWVRNFSFQIRFTIKRESGPNPDPVRTNPVQVQSFDFQVRFTIKRRVRTQSGPSLDLVRTESGRVGNSIFRYLLLFSSNLDHVQKCPESEVATLASIIPSTVTTTRVLWRRIRIFKCNRGLTFLNFMEAADVFQIQEGADVP